MLFLLLWQNTFFTFQTFFSKCKITFTKIAKLIA